MNIPHHDIWLNIKLIIGAALNAPYELKDGKIGSFTPNFIPSQNGCKTPPIPLT